MEDQSKVEVVMSWPQPKTAKELQRFLELANFYQHFIHVFSSVVVPLTSLLKGKPKTLRRTNEATGTFYTHKACFTSAPILYHPDPSLPFLIDVDASENRLGLILSQWHGNTAIMHPCTFYSRKLTQDECN